MNYKVRIFTITLLGVDKSYNFSADTYEEFKTGILKRLGNIIATNKQMKEKPLLKRKIWSANNFSELEEAFNSTDYWRIVIKK